MNSSVEVTCWPVLSQAPLVMLLPHLSLSFFSACWAICNTRLFSCGGWGNLKAWEAVVQQGGGSCCSAGLKLNLSFLTLSGRAVVLSFADTIICGAVL